MGIAVGSTCLAPGGGAAEHELVPSGIHRRRPFPCRGALATPGGQLTPITNHTAAIVASPLDPELADDMSTKFDWSYRDNFVSIHAVGLLAIPTRRRMQCFQPGAIRIPVRERLLVVG